MRLIPLLNAAQQQNTNPYLPVNYQSSGYGSYPSNYSYYPTYYYPAPYYWYGSR